jgi:glycerol uptake facilitator-like aquaporin
MAREMGAEALGTAMLLYVVVGSGVLIGGLSGDPTAGLLSHAIAVGGGLAVLIAVLIGVSGAHFNPAVTFASWRSGLIAGRQAIGYVLSQLGGAIIGVLLAHATFGLGLMSGASIDRAGLGSLIGEFVGTLFLVVTILILVDQGRTPWIPGAVGAWVGAMILMSPSGGLLNPAVTVARALTDTPTGVAPGGIPVLILVQLSAAFAATVLVTSLSGSRSNNKEVQHVGHPQQ